MSGQKKEDPRHYYQDDPFAIPEPYGDEAPEFFRKCDNQLKAQWLPRPDVVREPIEVPQEFVRGVEGADPIVYVTKDWYLKKKKKQVETRRKTMRDQQIKAMELLARQKVIHGKLGKLNPCKTKDARKIVKFNVELRNNEAELEHIAKMTGLPVRELDLGSEKDQEKGRFANAVKKIKKKIKKTGKKIKRFFRDNEETILQIAAMAIPLVLYLIIASHAAPVAAVAAAAV